KKPFFAGTYFPKENRYGRIGLIELLNNITKAWIENRDEILNSADEVTKYLQQIYSNKGAAVLNENIIDSAFQYFNSRFDTEFGGFGSAPKFPSPHNLMFLLRYWKRTGNEKALQIVTKTLTAMSNGGICDQIGFGFHRYSTDKQWLVPHLEKMLYDQAMMIIIYAEAYQVTHDTKYKTTAEEVIEYISRDLKSEEGGFFSAEDADSEGIEGKFYLWTKEEIKTVLDENEAELFANIYGITENGNFTEESSRTTGSNIPYLKDSLNELSKRYNQRPTDFIATINSIKKKLFAYREKRIHPFKDDKILTDWNALTISALAIAGRIFHNTDYIEMAKKSYQFIFDKFFNKNHILLHRYRGKQSDIFGNLDDYAYLIWASIELYQSTFESTYIEKSIKLAEHVIKHFWDEQYDGFYLTPGYAEKLIVRTKEIYDGALPSGNSVMALNLFQLARITANTKYDYYADKLFKTFGETITQSIGSVSYLMISYYYSTGPFHEVIVSAKNYSDEINNIINELNKAFIPNKIVILNTEHNKLPFEYLANYQTVNDTPLIYVCKNYECNLPVKTVEEALKQLEEKIAG
ncbi:MAG: thioredoxin domain-containing protein, partial [Elusimicrobiota bacterium]